MAYVVHKNSVEFLEVHKQATGGTTTQSQFKGIFLKCLNYLLHKCIFLKMVAMGTIQSRDSKAKGSDVYPWEDSKARKCHCPLYSMASRKYMVSTLSWFI